MKGKIIVKKTYIPIYILLVVFLLILESTFFSRLNFFGAQPNLVLVFVVTLTFFISRDSSIICALIAGGIEDFYIGRMIGSNMIAMILTIFIISHFTSRIIKENVLTPITVIFISLVINGILITSLIVLVGNGSLLNLMYIKNMLLGSVYNILLSLIIYPITYLIFYKFRREENK